MGISIQDLKNTQSRKNIMNILAQKEEFMVIGLTGRMGAGCSTVANILCSKYSDLNLPLPLPGYNGMRNDDERDLRIIMRFADSHWIPFECIKVRDVISTFILDNDVKFYKDLEKIIKINGKNKAEKQEKLENEIKLILQEINEILSNDEIDKENIIKKLDKIDKIFEKNKINEERKKKLQEVIETVKDNPTDKEKINQKLRMFNKLIETRKTNRELIEEMVIKRLQYENNLEDELKKSLRVLRDYLKGTQDSLTEFDNHIDKFNLFFNINDNIDEFIQKIKEYGKIFYEIYHVKENNIYKYDRKIIMETLNDIINILGKIILSKWYIKYKDSFWERLQKINMSFYDLKNDIEPFEKFIFVKYIINVLGSVIHDFIHKEYSPEIYTELFQKYGNAIRRYGTYYKDNEISSNRDEIFEIPRKINRFIKALRHPFDIEYHRPVFVVIDSLKNIFEAVYLNYRYSAFYMIAIYSDEKIRIERLRETDLNKTQINFLNWNEYPASGVEIYNKDKKKYDDYEKRYIDDLKDEENPIYDEVRKESFDENLYSFYLQDVERCIDGADIFISNSQNEKNQISLKLALVRIISLIMFPGLVQPTSVEKCMQIAYSAKVNSGCLSRQVGAVVTDSEYNILSVAWNDVPCGDISCSRKNLLDIYKYQDKEAYTEYELIDPDFRERLNKKYNFSGKYIKEALHGMPFSYCFKDLHTDKRNSMRSRAMHGEEKALAICGDKAIGGNLFTTSSPCEMCSKNAKNHKIKKIYYIEHYPGISFSQYSNSGDKSNIAQHILFTGAVGRAYTQIYTPIMPYKDILSFLNINSYFE